MHTHKQLYPKERALGSRQATLVRCLKKVPQRSEIRTWLLTERCGNTGRQKGGDWAIMGWERHVQTQFMREGAWPIGHLQCRRHMGCVERVKKRNR